MESIVKFLEKGQPYFDKVSKNIYLQAIKDGFLAAMPIILSSSVFLLISTLPGVVATVGGFTLPDWWNVDVVNFCNKVYNFTMGVVGIMVAGTTASALTGSKNRRMPAGKAINATSTMVAAMCKLNASENARFVTNLALQIHGGYGYMKEYPIKKAMELLRTTNDSIASIATCVGYETQGKFTKAFKDVALQLPTEYRKIHRHDR